ncbi:serine hydrolase domain-containing protein [Simiduia agarivorans]|uniref:Beta-lactamase n=1 Tax=Simiduia agarivorans (strain DSM 21679 / JCM 13881 / BCRC 17597 / SA1) TaxID=1117647 RepID=K4KLY6_SIMAS|nr:serine hydrolase domain-containing protein [Simiduia agarivorans]AFV00052.1 beta-lactamase [Simiduia agarivorans SA1 = DSM 21679]
MTLLRLLLMGALLVNHTGVFAEEAAPTDYQALEQQLLTTLLEENIPGAQVALFDSHGVRWLRSLGQSHRDTQSSMSDAHLLRAGSTSKILVSLAVQKMIQAGHFSLASPVQELAPEIAISNPYPASPVRVIHLLEHTAGLDDMHFKNMFDHTYSGIALLEAINRDAEALTVRWPPGQWHSYSNPGYAILGYLVEKFSGQPFEHYVQNEVIAPLGMSASRFYKSGQAIDALAGGHDDTGPVPFTPIYLRPAGALLSNAQDLATLGSALLSTRVESELALARGTVSDMESPTSSSAARAGLSFGYGQGIYQASANNHRWYGHDGGITGFVTSLLYSRELDRGFVIMLNSHTGSMRRVQSVLTDYLLAATPATPVIARDAISPDIDGYYRLVNHRNEIMAGLMYFAAVIKAEAAGSELVFNPLIGSEEHTTHIGQQLFVEGKRAHATVVFGQENGQEFIHIDGQQFEKISVVSAWWFLLTVGFSALLLPLCVLYAPIWLINYWRGKIRGYQRVLLRVLPLCASFGLLGALLAATQLTLDSVGLVNAKTLAIAIGSLLFGLLSAVNLLCVWRWHRLEAGRLARGLSGLFALGFAYLSIYLLAFDYIGIALWAW